MFKSRTISTLSLLCSLFLCTSFYVSATNVSVLADNTAEYAAKTYPDAMVTSLAELVTFNTMAIDGVPSTENPVHIAFKAALKKQATALGFDFKDDGYVVVIGLGDHKDRLGIITHGDVQPADISKWKKSPYELDTTSEPGKLIARGSEDDKGPIATVLYAMKAVKDKNIPLNKRIELYIYMAEESDWQPLEEYIATHELPALNITLDSNYPVVTAEKGYGMINIAFTKRDIVTSEPYISEFSGGSFGSQIPEDAKAVINNASPSLLSKLFEQAKRYANVGFDFNLKGTELTVIAKGKSAHSSNPSDGINAITHLAHFLSLNLTWPNNGAGTLANFVNDNIGLSLEGELFGNIAFSDEFMGPLTVSPTVIKQHKDNVELKINMRQPRGKKREQLLSEIEHTITDWQKINKAQLAMVDPFLDEPFVQTSAPQIETLLAVFSKYTGIKDAKPVAIGGGTNSRLFPTAVSFGPSMPGAVYTGHSEHEFITMEQFVLNLKMYTAALVELAK